MDFPRKAFLQFEYLKFREFLWQISDHSKVALIWVPAYLDIIENSNAVELVKAGTELTISNMLRFIGTQLNYKLSTHLTVSLNFVGNWRSLAVLLDSAGSMWTKQSSYCYILLMAGTGKKFSLWKITSAGVVNFRRRKRLSFISCYVISCTEYFDLPFSDILVKHFQLRHLFLIRDDFL